MFLRNDNRPVLTVMLKSDTKEDIISEIKRANKQGAEAFGYQAELLKKDLRSYDNLKEIFSCMENKPIYFTNYRRGNLYPEMSDDELCDEMMTALDAGASLIDIPGDFFCPSWGEIATSNEAIDKQKKFISEVHKKGGEILMSSHVLKYIPKESVLAIAYQHKERGADISKIVTEANTYDELQENMEASLLLKRKLGIKHLFLCNGSECKMHRRISPLTGDGMFLVTEDNAEVQNQPKISEAREILNRTMQGEN